MPHFKILGWLWLAFGLFWSILTACVLLAPSAEIGQNVIVSAWAWWTELIGDILEGSFFVASGVVGLALLRRWRWAQGAVGILGIVTLSIWVLLALSPTSPPASLGTSMLFLSPLFVLAVYSLVVLLLPSPEGCLSRRSKLLIAGGSLVGVFFAIAFHAVAFQDPPLTPAEASARVNAHSEAYSHLQFENLRSAADAFARDQKAKGLSVPGAVTFNELALHGYLPPGEVAPFSNAEATVSFKAAEGVPGIPWISIRWKDGSGMSMPYAKPGPQ